MLSWDNQRKPSGKQQKGEPWCEQELALEEVLSPTGKGDHCRWVANRLAHVVSRRCTSAGQEAQEVCTGSLHRTTMIAGQAYLLKARRSKSGNWEIKPAGNPEGPRRAAGQMSARNVPLSQSLTGSQSLWSVPNGTLTATFTIA